MRDLKIIRTFVPDDLDAILTVFYEAVHTTGSKYYNQVQVKAWAPEELDKEVWLNSLLANIAYVAEVDGKIVGFGDMTPTGYIDRLYVLQNYQGQGIARILLKRLEAEAYKLGLKELTTEASIVAMPLAKRWGYEIVTEQRKIYRGMEFINYLMRKELKK